MYGIINVKTKLLEDSIIFRNNMPTYHLASVIDDFLMNITHVIRGKEWISSTPIHIIIYKYFNWKTPKFVHLPLILNNNGGKISKRINNYSNTPLYPIYKYYKIKNSFKIKGFLPEAVFNFIALLGWNPNPNKNKIIYKKKKLISLFSFKNINKSDIHLNYSMLCWINKKYLNKKKNFKIIYSFLKKKINKLNINIKNKNIKKIIKLTKNRISLINQIWDVSYYFFINPINYKIPIYLKKYINFNKKKIIFFFNNIKKVFFKNKNKKKIKKIINKINNVFLLKLLRISIVGELIGINIIDILYIIKNNIILNRINLFLKKIN
ncbi:MAG: glutamate--tRNA ligase family protein [Candidatus Shikimatogenerans bostrichidophilus]|nr:MAG: glutamate--tRNA ligase family protein [Candidatus Shikimatogenerans bostrichidophilus]